MNIWELPQSVCLAGKTVPHRSDFREILKLLGVLDDPTTPELLRWYTALAYFYLAPVPRQAEQAAMDYLSQFLTCGQPAKPGPRRFDWEQDGAAIVSDVNGAAGKELRGEVYVHWWTFLGYFHSLDKGQLSLRISIRDKLRRHEKLEPWEQTYYRENRELIDLKKQASPEEEGEKKALLARLEKLERRS